MNETARPAARKTQLMLATLATCPRRYLTEYVNEYRAKGKRPKPWPPDLKSVLRDALRDRDYASMRGLSKVRIRAAAEAVVSAYEDELTYLIGQVPKDEYDRLQGNITSITREARSILSHYADALGEDEYEYMLDPHGRPLVDRIFEDHVASDLDYAGRIEAVVKRNGLVTVLLRKFTSNSDPRQVIADLELDLNTMAAMWIATRAANATVTTAVVEVVRTKAPSVPETIQCRKCKGLGHKPDDERSVCETCTGTGIGGMSKRPCDTTLDEWTKAVARSGLDVQAERERCSEVVSKITNRGETFAYQVDIEVSPQVILNWKEDVVALAGVEAHYIKTGTWPRNRSACVTRSSACPYRKTCGHDTGENDSAWFEKVTDQYPGLE